MLNEEVVSPEDSLIHINLNAIFLKLVDPIATRELNPLIGVKDLGNGFAIMAFR
jgi:hypothetical protein